MALYEPASSWARASNTCKIPKTEVIDGITLYVIEVHISPYTWFVRHRYNDFHELHERLIVCHHVDKNLLPPKKIFGSQSESFIMKRQAELELYLQTLIHQFSVPPNCLASFLDFPAYEVRTIAGNLSEKLFYQGDLILSRKQGFQFSPLELHAITKRLKLAEPTCLSGDKRQDLGHLLAFVSQLKHLIINGSYEAIGTSDIVANDLTFDLTPFKLLESLEIHCCKLQDRMQTTELLRKNLKVLTVHKTLKELSSILLCGVIHWSPNDPVSYWPCWHFVTFADLSNNYLTSIHPSVRLLTAVESIDFSHNNIQEIENLESLPRLAVLNLSHNKLSHLPALHTRLGNIRSLHLAGNMVECLQGLSRLFSLVDLQLNDNQILSLAEVAYIGALPCLEKLNLANNPINSTIDYRAHILLAFGPRAAEVILDGEKASEKEVDTVAVLQALQVARKEQITHHNSQRICSTDKNSSIPMEFGGDQALYRNSVNR